MILQIPRSARRAAVYVIAETVEVLALHVSETVCEAGLNSGAGEGDRHWRACRIARHRHCALALPAEVGLKLELIVKSVLATE